MILRLNGSIIEPESKGIMDHINDFSDWVIGKEAEFITGPATNTLKGLIDLLNTQSAEIITLGIVVCAIGLMVAGSGKWLSRLFMVFWGGVIWRMLT